MSENERLIAGAMSGTSADGVDVAIVRIRGRGQGMSAELLHHHHREYDAELKKAIFAMRGDGAVKLAELGRVGRQISLAYATAVNEALLASGLNSGKLAAVAAHGQTLYHEVPVTIQWLDPALVAAEVGCAVVSDFRRADCAAGGQGAPLVPFADYILFRDSKKSRVLLNIGGIANLTYLKAGGALEEVIAFDTGPGNCVMDYLCRKYDPTGPGYDGDGRLSNGSGDWKLGNWVVNHHPFFQRLPPKSTDGPEMIKAFEEAPLSVQPYVGRRSAWSELGLRDLLGTACLLTARSIQNACYKFLPKLPEEVIVSGGGLNNPALMCAIEFEFPVRFLTTDQFGIPSQSKEALAFALLGAATLDGEPSNVPSVTGAKRAVVLGSVTPKP